MVTHCDTLCCALHSVAQCRHHHLHHHHHPNQCRASVSNMMIGAWITQNPVIKYTQGWVGMRPWHPHCLILHPVRISLSIKHAYWMAIESFLHCPGHPNVSGIIIMRRLLPFLSINVSSHLSQEQTHISESFQRGMEVKHLLGVMAKFQVSTINRRVDRDFWMREMSMLNLGPKRTLNPQPQFSNSPTPTLNSNVAWVLDRLSCLSMS